MRKLLFIFLFFIAFSVCYAEEKATQEYLFPVPAGDVVVTNAYGKTVTHKGARAGYSIDLQLTGTNPKFPNMGGSQCFSLGTPILASRSGKVLRVDNPTGGNLEKNYGVMVRVGYDDKSYTTYGHLLPNTLAVEVGEEVVAGQILGLMGATGNVFGKVCAWEEESITEITKHRGTHLHLETNNSKGLAVKQEPLVGKEAYTDITAVKTYTSATTMIDPKGHWEKFAGRVPYVYNGTYVTMASASSYQPRIHSITPAVAIAGTNQTFTIKGENLPKTIQPVLHGCRNLKWIKQEPTEQRFSCDLPKNPGPLKGFVRFTPPPGIIELNFTINTVNKLESEDFPEIKNVQIENPKAGQEVKFIVTGTSLPNDLRPDMEECKDFKYKIAGPMRLEFSCKLPHTIKDVKGKRPNGIHRFHTNLVSASTDFSYPTSFTVDYQVQVKSISPVSMLYDKEATIVLEGKNLDLAKAIWVESCDKMKIMEHTEKRIKVACVPYKPKSNLVLPIDIPIWAKNEIYDVVLKDEPKGVTLFERGILVGVIPGDVPVNFKTEEALFSEDQSNLLKATDDIINYILKVKGNYDDTFLKKVGWKKEVDSTGKTIYTPRECKSELKSKNAQNNMKKDCLK